MEIFKADATVFDTRDSFVGREKNVPVLMPSTEPRAWTILSPFISTDPIQGLKKETGVEINLINS